MIPIKDNFRYYFWCIYLLNSPVLKIYIQILNWKLSQLIFNWNSSVVQNKIATSKKRKLKSPHFSNKKSKIAIFLKLVMK